MLQSLVTGTAGRALELWTVAGVKFRLVALGPTAAVVATVAAALAILEGLTPAPR